MVALRSISLKGKVEFLKATAGGHGAGIYMEAGGLDASNLCFKGCTAEHDGAAIFVQGPATLQHLETEQCTSSVSSSVLYAKGDLSVSDLTTNMKPSKSDSGNQYLNSAGIAYVTSWMCKSEQKCALVAEKGGNITKMYQDGLFAWHWIHDFVIHYPRVLPVPPRVTSLGLFCGIQHVLFMP